MLIMEMVLRINMVHNQTTTSLQVLGRAMDIAHRFGIQTSMTSRGRFLHISKGKQNSKWVVIKIKTIKTAEVVSNITKLKHTTLQASNSPEVLRVEQEEWPDNVVATITRVSLLLTVLLLMIKLLKERLLHIMHKAMPAIITKGMDSKMIINKMIKATMAMEVVATTIIIRKAIIIREDEHFE